MMSSFMPEDEISIKEAIRILREHTGPVFGGVALTPDDVSYVVVTKQSVLEILRDMCKGGYTGSVVLSKRDDSIFFG